MAVTFREMMNRVLSNLTEDELSVSVTEITDTYEKLIRNFINHIKEEMEDGAQWRTLRTTVAASALANAESVALPGTNDRSRLVRIYDSQRYQVLPMVHNVTDPDNPWRMIELDLPELQRRRREDTSEPVVEKSSYFAIDQDDDGLVLVIWQASTTAQDFLVEVVVPQERFVGDATDLDTNIKVPASPLELGATWYALEERGEELGVNGLFSQERYKLSVDSAIARDDGEAGSHDLVSV